MEQDLSTNVTASLQPICFAGALIPTQVYAPVRTMPKPTTLVQVKSCVGMLSPLSAETEMPNQIRGKLPERRQLKQGKCKRCHCHLFLLLSGKSLPLAQLWSIPSLPTCSKVSKWCLLWPQKRRNYFSDSALEYELPEVRATGSRQNNNSEENPVPVEPNRIFPVVFPWKNMSLSGSYH